MSVYCPGPKRTRPLTRRGLVTCLAGFATAHIHGWASAASLEGNPFLDGQSFSFDGMEYFLTDVIVPSIAPLGGGKESGATYAANELMRIISRGAPIKERLRTRDRWGRYTGPLSWRMADGRETTIQEMMLAAGAGRTAPQSENFEFIDRCLIAEDLARELKNGLWALDDYRILDAASDERVYGYQIYAGAVERAEMRRGRVYFNFGADYRSDFTASLRVSDFRRWRTPIEPESLVDADVEIRGLVNWINGPSIDLLHEKQLRRR